ncbi:MAG: PqqD family protein [Bacillota bacterium]
MKKIPVRNEDIVWRNLEGEAVLLNPHSGKYYGLNEVGCSFWEKVDGKSSLESIVELLLEEYDVDRGTLEQDLEELVQELEKREIISFAK